MNTYVSCDKNDKLRFREVFVISRGESDVYCLEAFRNSSFLHFDMFAGVEYSTKNIIHNKWIPLMNRGRNNITMTWRVYWMNM